MLENRYGHSGAVIWLTGLSGSGKTTLALMLEKELLALGYACHTLDGDSLRQGLNADLGFSQKDRIENIRRVGEVAALFADAGLICITACISPYRDGRRLARAKAQRTCFHEVYVAASLDVCEARDPKGLYRKARSGDIPDFTGIDSPYEPPETPDLIIDTGQESVQTSLARLLNYVCIHLPRGVARRMGQMQTDYYP